MVTYIWQDSDLLARMWYYHNLKIRLPSPDFHVRYLLLWKPILHMLCMCIHQHCAIASRNLEAWLSYSNSRYSKNCSETARTWQIRFLWAFLVAAVLDWTYHQPRLESAMVSPARHDCIEHCPESVNWQVGLILSRVWVTAESRHVEIMLRSTASFGCTEKLQVNLDEIYPLISKNWGWPGSEKITLINVKVHAGCLLNKLVGERVEKGSLPDANSICLGPKTYI